MQLRKFEKHAHFLRSDLGEVVKGVVLYSGVTIISMVVSYVALWIVANVYGAESVGLISLGVAVSSLLMFVFMLGMPNGAILHFAHHLQSSTDTRRVLFYRYLVLTASVSILAAIVMYFLSYNTVLLKFKDERVAKLFKIFSYMLPVLCFQRLLVSSFMGIKCVGLSTMMTKLFPSACNLSILLFSWWFFEKTYLIPVYAHVISITMTVGIGFWLWRKVSASMPNGLDTVPPPTYSEILKVSFPMMITGSMLLLLRWTDTVVLGIYQPVEEVGVYQIAQRISNFPFFIFMAVSSISAPKFAELHKLGDLKRVRETAWHASRLISGVSIPFFIFIATFSEFILGVFGEEFRGSSDVLLLLLTSVMATSISGLIGPFLNMTGHQRKISFIMAGGALLNLILNFMWIPSMGARGAALATCLSTISWNAAATFLIWKIFGFTVGFKLPFLNRFWKS